MIGRELDEWDVTTPAGVGGALGMAPSEAMALLSWHRGRDDDLLILEAAAARLGAGAGAGPVAPMNLIPNHPTIQPSNHPTDGQLGRPSHTILKDLDGMIVQPSFALKPPARRRWAI